KPPSYEGFPSVGREGLEPSTYGLKIHSSNLLSYRPEGRDLYSIADARFNGHIASAVGQPGGLLAPLAEFCHASAKQALETREHLFARLDAQFVDGQVGHRPVREIEQQLYRAATRVV